MPHRSTIYDWADGLVAEVPDTFPDRFKRAKRRQAYTFLEDILEIADCGTFDLIEKQGKNGNTFEVWNHDWFQRSKLMIETRKYLIDRTLGTSQTEDKKDEELAKRYVDTAPQAESYEEWLKQHKPSTQ